VTKFQPLDLRPQGQAWPGLNTRGGFLSNGTGQLADGSFNGVIERGDVLRKRRGLIRGLDERFVGVVCGLFKYTDECGVEYLLVADEEGIKIREPFEIPVFTVSDAYPNDTFSSTGAPNALNWRNTSRYTQTSDTLVLLGSAAPSLAAQVPSTSLMRWFKDAANPSYQVQVQYEFDGGLVSRQRVAIVIRGNNDLTTGALLQADLERTPGSTYRAHIWHRRADGTYRELLFAEVPSPAQNSGFFTFRYRRDIVSQPQQFTAGFNVTANGGVIVDQDSPTMLTEIEDNDLGLTSAIAMDRSIASSSTAHRLLVVSGGEL